MIEKIKSAIKDIIPFDKAYIDANEITVEVNEKDETTILLAAMLVYPPEKKAMPIYAKLTNGKIKRLTITPEWIEDYHAREEEIIKEEKMCDKIIENMIKKMGGG